MSREEHYRKLERMYMSVPFNTQHNPVMRVSEGQAQLTIEATPAHHHAAHAVHGAMYFKMLDDTTFFAANSLVEDVFVLTVSFNLYLTRPISTGLMIATSRAVFQSRRLYIAEGEIVNEVGQQIARGSGTFMPGRTPLSPEIGYV